jgi:Sec-independent protein secretion pathway component TatC
MAKSAKNIKTVKFHGGMMTSFYYTSPYTAHFLYSYSTDHKLKVSIHCWNNKSINFLNKYVVLRSVRLSNTSTRFSLEERFTPTSH